MRIQFSQSSYMDTEENSILNDIAKTRYALENAYAGFDNATDPDLIDCYIYEVNAIQKRYKYLLQQAANMNLLPQTPVQKQETTMPPDGLCEQAPAYPLIG